MELAQIEARAELPRGALAQLLEFPLADLVGQRLTGRGLALGCVGASRETRFAAKAEALGQARARSAELTLTPAQAARAGLPVKADGQRRTCLFSRREWDLKTSLRDGSSDAELVERVRFAVRHKELKHRINDPGFVRASRSMSQIGG